MLKKILATVTALAVALWQPFCFETAGIADINLEADEPIVYNAGSNVAVEHVDTAESSVADFLITAPDGSESTCSKEEINENVSYAQSGTVFKLNRCVELNSMLSFTEQGQFTIDLDGHTLSAVEGSRMLDIESGAEVTVRDGTLSGGTPTGGGWNNNGGAAYVEAATLTASNVTFSNNRARLGSAIYATSNYNTDKPSYIQLNNCTVCDNSIVNSSNYTGTIDVDGSYFKADNLLLKNNTSDGACAGILLNSKLLKMVYNIVCKF